MYRPMLPRFGAIPPRLSPSGYAGTRPPQYGLVDLFRNPSLELASTGGGLTAAWGSAAGASTRPIAANTHKRALKPVENFHRPTIWDPDIGAYVPLVIDGAGNRLHPFAAGLIDDLVKVDPNSDEQIDQARLGIDQLLTDSPQTRNWFHKTFSDYLAGDLSPEEASAEFADRGDERLRANRATANIFAEGILAAEGVRQATILPPGPYRPSIRQRPAGSAAESDSLPTASHTRDPMPEAEYRALPSEGLIDPNRIRTLQDSISQRYKPMRGGTIGRHIKESIDEMRTTGAYPERFESIRIYVQNGGVWALDHRRLVAARLAGVPVRYKKAAANDVAKEIGNKATTVDDGLSIVIRPEKGIE